LTKRFYQRIAHAGHIAMHLLFHDCSFVCPFFSCPHELMQVLARFTGVLNREIAVYITRDGEVVDVSIGTDRDVELLDDRLRRNTQRLSCVRCIHTHPNGDGRLSDVDLSALRSFRYDAMVAIGCLKGEPTFVQSAFLVEKQNLLMDEPVAGTRRPMATGCGKSPRVTALSAGRRMRRAHMPRSALC